MSKLDSTLQAIREKDAGILLASTFSLAMLSAVPLLAWLVFKYSMFTIFIVAVAWGILCPMLFAGIASIFLERGQNHSWYACIKRLFDYAPKWKEFFVLSLISSAGITAGLLLLLPGIVLAVMWMYAPFYVAFENKNPLDAMRLSWRTVLNGGFVKHIKMFVSLVLLNLAGIALLMVGEIYAYAITNGFLALSWQEIKE